MYLGKHELPLEIWEYIKRCEYGIVIEKLSLMVHTKSVVIYHEGDPYWSISKHSLKWAWKPLQHECYCHIHKKEANDTMGPLILCVLVDQYHDKCIPS